MPSPLPEYHLNPTTTLEGPVYIFTDEAIVPPPKDNGSSPLVDKEKPKDSISSGGPNRVSEGSAGLGASRREELHESAFAQELVLEGLREAVLHVLTFRFGEEAKNESVEAISRITDGEQLKTLLELAFRSRRFSQFRKALPAK
jgi:hypothetical protein